MLKQTVQRYLHNKAQSATKLAPLKLSAQYYCQLIHPVTTCQAGFLREQQKHKQLEKDATSKRKY